MASRRVVRRPWQLTTATLPFADTTTDLMMTQCYCLATPELCSASELLERSLVAAESQTARAGGAATAAGENFECPCLQLPSDWKTTGSGAVVAESAAGLG